jgi:RNA polymerase sigma factor (sigma-70 family)
MIQMSDQPRTGTALAAAENMTDAELVQGARAGQHDAWEMLVQRYNGHLCRVARSFRLDQATCDDVVQTAWLRLVEHLGTLRDPDRVCAWLVTTLRRDIYAVFRGRGMEPDLAGPAIADLPDPGRSPEQEVTARDQDAQVGAALQRLPARDRELLTLLMDSPAPRYSDVSARLKMPVGSIGPRRARSLGRLRRELNVAGIDGELASA